MRAEKLCLLLGLCFVAGVAQAQETKTVKPTEKVDSAELFDKILDSDSVVTHGPNDWCSPHLMQPPSSGVTPTPQDSDAPVDPTTIRPRGTLDQLMSQPSVSSQPQQSMAFNTNSLASSGVGASRNVPAMLGDFFGTAGTFEARIPQPLVIKNVFNRFEPILNFDRGRAVFGPKPFYLDPTYGFGDPNSEFTVDIFSREAVVNSAGTSQVPWGDDAGYDFFEITSYNSYDTPTPTQDDIVVATDGSKTTLFLEGIGILDDPNGFVYPAIGDVDFLITPENQGPTDNTAADGNNVDNSNWKPGGDALFLLATVAEYSVETVRVPIAPTSGRIKLAENSSPLPQDRIMLNFGAYSNVDLAPGGVAVNRYTPGFEKTFFDGNASFTLQTPFATTLDSDLTQGMNRRNEVEFGDTFTTFKYLFYRNSSLALSGGFGMSFPTADSLSFARDDGVEIFEIRNDTVHMMPYIGGVWTPSRKFFWQTMFQVDTPLNGNEVRFNQDPNNLVRVLEDSGVTVVGAPAKPGLSYIGKLDDPTFMYLDTSLGYWFYQADANERATKRGITGVSGILELHYNRTLNNFDQVESDVFLSNKQFVIGDSSVSFEQLNCTIGSVIEISGDTSISFGYATPLTQRRVFDGEFRCNFTHLFGRSSKRAYSNRYGNQVRNRSL